MSPARIFGLLVLAALASGVLVGCTTTFHDGARPGQAQAGGGGTVDSPTSKVVVQLPLGPLTLEVGKPTREIEVVEGSGRAADGATWVPIAWTLGGNGADYENAVPAFQFQVTLVADGRRYGLQAGQAGDSDEAASKYTPVVKEKSLDVVVLGDGQRLGADVEYDGVTQHVDFDSGRIDAGPAAPLYRTEAQTPRLARTTCPLLSAADAGHFRVSPSTQCMVGAVTTAPYVGGLGWVSSPGETWTLVPIDLHVIEIDADEALARYADFSSAQLTVTVDGRKPTTEILGYRDRDHVTILEGGIYVFRTTSAPTAVGVSVTVRGQDEYHPSRFRTFHGERTYRLG
jgi:hypothetical protein